MAGLRYTIHMTEWQDVQDTLGSLKAHGMGFRFVCQAVNPPCANSTGDVLDSLIERYGPDHAYLNVDFGKNRRCSKCGHLGAGVRLIANDKSAYAKSKGV